MAKNITLMGASYPDVPAVELPQTGGGTATFYDVQGSKNIDTNGTYDVTTFSEVSVNVSGGGGASSDICVEFVDGYYGNVLYSYTKNDFLNLSSMPSNPTISGLISQGWNWNLASAKEYIQKHDYLCIGQNYITESGDTEIDIVLEDGRTRPYLCIAVNGSVSVDWGDDSSISTITGRSLTSSIATLHEYSSPGSYTITISVVSGKFALYRTTSSSGQYRLGLLSNYSTTANSNLVYLNTIVSVRLGNNVNVGDYSFYYCFSLKNISIPNTITSIGNYAFSYCHALESVSLPNTITSIGNYAFNRGYSLKRVSIPNGVTSIGNSAFDYCNSLITISIPDTVVGTSIGTSVFSSCRSLVYVSISNKITKISDYMFSWCVLIPLISIPDTVTIIGAYAFQGCESFQTISIPDTVTSIGNYAFNGCTALESISIPDTVTSIGSSAFRSCYSLKTISISDTVTSMGTDVFYDCFALRSISISANITSIGSNMFRNCYSLQTISISDTVTIIDTYAFAYCSSLRSLSIPSRVTTIATRAFEACYSLQTISIPDTVTSIGNYAFNSCMGLSKIIFSSSTPPSLGGSQVFQNVQTDCKIYVPRGTLNTYTSTTNYPSSSTYTYVEYDV